MFLIFAKSCIHCLPLSASPVPYDLQMGEIVKQLFTSPVADSPPVFTPTAVKAVDFGPVLRLDAALNLGTDRQAPAPVQQSQPAERVRLAFFKVPSDDEEDDETDFDFDEAAARARTPLSSHTMYSNDTLMNARTTTPGSQQQQSHAPESPGWAMMHTSVSSSYPTQQQQSMSNFSTISISSASARHPVQAVLEARTKQLQADALLMADKQQRRLHDQLRSVEEQLSVQLQEVQQQLQQKRARAAAADEESRKQRSAERTKRLQEVQRQQQALEQAQATAVQEVKRAQEEAARKQAEAEARLRQQQEEERKKKEAEAAAAAAAKAEAEARAREAAAKQAQQQQQQQQQHQQQQQQAQSTTAAAAPQPAGTPPSAASNVAGGHLKSTPAALQYEQQLQQKLVEAEAAADELRNQPELKQQRRTLEKQITMAVSQISGTQEQVQAKSRQLIQVLQSCTTPQQQALAYVTLASRVVSQCDGQVQKIGSFAFPLGYVCVAVGAAVPAFMELLLAKLQQACPLLVPKYTMYSKDQSTDDWYKALGYKTIEDPKTGQMRRENSDEFVARMSAMVLLYGSMVQTDAPGNPAGLAHGWAWLARCVNALPPTRPAATALMSFLAHAGYRMAAVYGRQFVKVMEHLTTHYLPALEAKATKDADLRAVGTRLQTYITARQYLKEPEGRTLKKVDESSYTRA